MDDSSLVAFNNVITVGLLLLYARMHNVIILSLSRDEDIHVLYTLGGTRYLSM